MLAYPPWASTPGLLAGEIPVVFIIPQYPSLVRPIFFPTLADMGTSGIGTSTGDGSVCDYTFLITLKLIPVSLLSCLMETPFSRSFFRGQGDGSLVPGSGFGL